VIDPDAYPTLVPSQVAKCHNIPNGLRHDSPNPLVG
jgi:hypothetical protein